MKKIYIMLRLEMFAIWLRRICHCRGFGVQSPSDYRFVRYVVNEHYPYYAYDDLERELPDVSSRKRKLCRLYFRIANYLQPEVVVNQQPCIEAYTDYIHRGCNKATVYGELPSNGCVDLLRVNADDAGMAIFQSSKDALTERSMVLVEGIKKDKNAKAVWRSIRNDAQVSVTFDLYYVGVALFTKGRYKQNYKVNF